MSEKSSERDVTNKNNDAAGKAEGLFEIIKRIQSLPDEVVNDFLRCKGAVNSAGFKEKYLKNVR